MVMSVESEDFDRQFGIVVSGAERTRGVMYFFCLVLIVNIVFFFEDAFNTTGRRLEIIGAANACIGQSTAPSGAVPLQFDDKSHTCEFYYNYVSKYYGINIPVAGTIRLDLQSEMAFNEKYKALLKDDTESLSTNVPLLNIKIDRNAGLILQNSLGVLVLFVLMLSLEAERKSLNTIGQLIGGNYFRSKAILDTHVFSRLPAGQVFLFAAVFAPAAMQLFRIIQDFSEYKVVIDVYGGLRGSLYLECELVSLIAVLFVAGRCFSKAKHLNSSLMLFEQQIGLEAVNG
jgi:hypothetical protein